MEAINKQEERIVQVNIKIPEDDNTSNAVCLRFDVIAKAMQLSKQQAVIQALNEFNITHASVLNDMAYQIPETK